MCLKQNFLFIMYRLLPLMVNYPKDAAAYLRKQQETALTLTKTGIISIGDLVDDVKDIHPRLKA